MLLVFYSAPMYICSSKAGSRELRITPQLWTAVNKSAAPLRYVERYGGMVNSIVDDDGTRNSTVNSIKAWGGTVVPMFS